MWSSLNHTFWNYKYLWIYTNKNIGNKKLNGSLLQLYFDTYSEYTTTQKLDKTVNFPKQVHKASLSLVWSQY